MGENMVKYGLGLMRLPLLDENDQTSVDIDEVQRMVDECMENGVNFFDTAVPYHLGKSEEALRKTLVDKYPRDSFLISDKLPLFNIQKEEDMEYYFNTSLEKLGIDYFDYYMLHNVSNWTKTIYRNIDCFSFIKQKKQEGLAKKIGISFHDKPKLLRKTLEENPELDFVLLQINYLDWDSQSFKVNELYDISVEYGLEILVMEPLKGGTIINIPDEAEQLLKNYNPKDSIAKWGLRFSGSLDNVSYVLSGAKNHNQTRENIETFRNFKPLNLNEVELLRKTAKIINDSIAIPCTECRYCMEDGICPHNIPISEYFSLYNDAKRVGFKDFSTQQVMYRTIGLNPDYGLASDCEECGECSKICPQKLKIPKLLKQVYEEFETTM